MAPYRPAPPYPQRPYPAPVIAYPPPRARRSHAGLALLIALGVTLVIVLAVGLANALSGSTSNPPVQAPAAPAATRPSHDVTADFQAWLNNYLPDAKSDAPASAITRVRTDVETYDLVVDTALYPKRSNEWNAKGVCGLGSAYLLQQGKDPTASSIKVNDSAGNVLVSHHSTGGTCDWRRPDLT